MTWQSEVRTGSPQPGTHLGPGSLLTPGRRAAGGDRVDKDAQDYCESQMSTSCQRFEKQKN